MIADCQKWILFVCISLMFIEASKWTWSFSPSAQHQWGTVQNQKLYYTQSTRPWEKNGLDWENSRITLNQYEWAQLFKKSHQHWKSGTLIAGCNCHLAHLAACKGREGYCSATSFDIKEHQLTCFTFLKTAQGENAFWPSICINQMCLTRDMLWQRTVQVWKLKSILMSPSDKDSRCGTDTGLEGK